MATGQFSTTLREMIGHVKRLKPNIDPLLVADFLNQRVRSALDRRTVWAGTLRSGTVSIPGSYSTGSIALANGSATATGTSTAWPVSDVVNTTITAGVPRTGLQVISPASMVGIGPDTVLYVDAGGANPEIVPVLETGLSSFKAAFKYTHAAGCTITASSLAGRQIRLTNTYPTYSIRAITSATSAVLDKPWAGVAYSGNYNIVQMYYTLAPDLKYVLHMADTVQMIPMRVHVSQAELNTTDPQRAQVGPPHTLADYVPNECGNMQYEIYPIQTGARQLPYLYAAQWPDMRSDGDRPPYFINPNVFIWGAAAQALLTKVEPNDAFYDPAASQRYEMMAQAELNEAMKADEGKAQQAFSSERNRLWSMGANWAQSHAVSVTDGLYGGDSGGEWW